MNPMMIPGEALIGLVIADMLTDGLVVTLSRKRCVVSSEDGTLLAEGDIRSCCSAHLVLSFLAVVEQVNTVMRWKDEKDGRLKAQVERLESWLQAGGVPQADA